jgi:acetoin utilization deacetylase AcuC-like enzyme
MPAFVHHPHYRAVLEDGHAVTINKYQRIAEILIEEGLDGGRGLVLPDPADAATLALAHDPGYVQAALELALPDEMRRRIGLPMTQEVVRRACAVCGGTLLAARLALAEGLACNTAGGSHHAARAAGAGYCIFNDVAVAAAALLAGGEAQRILVIDLDVHQGDGTAGIFADEPRVFTFSMHAAKNFPVRKARSDLDVPLEDGVEDAAYLDILGRHLSALLEPGWDLVLYVAGVDPHRDDRLGRLALTDAGLFRRDRAVLEACRVRRIPLAGVLGGGYDRDVDRIARRHLLLHRAAAERDGLQDRPLPDGLGSRA